MWHMICYDLLNKFSILSLFFNKFCLQDFSINALMTLLPWHSTASGSRENCPSITFFSGYFVFKNEGVKVRVRYGFVLYTGLPFAVSIGQTDKIKIRG